MRHNKSGRKLNRTNSHRKAMFRNMARALLTYESIRTTEAKAKELRKVVDSLITLAVRNDLHARRMAYKVLNNHQMVKVLFDEIGPRFKEGGGGYTRILKMAQPRKGDCAPMVLIELTKKAADEAKQEEPKAKAEKKDAPKKAEAPKKEAPKAEEAPAEETPEAEEKSE
ncbi:MAG: 50S ribosomal protein L17 [Desulfovibrionaceae bacterium]